MSTPDEPERPEPPPEPWPWDRPRLGPQPPHWSRQQPRPAPGPETTGTPPKRDKPDPATRWVAIGSIGAVVAALVAILAYAAPRPSAAPAAATSPASNYSAPAATLTTPSPTTPAPTTPAPTTPARTTPAATPTTSAPAPVSIQAGPPAGCDEARAAVVTYDQTAGSTTDSQASAALQAYDTLLPLSTVAAGAVSSDITNVAEDFYLMNQIQTGALDQSYQAAGQQTNSDIQTLSAACGFGSGPGAS